MSDPSLADRLAAVGTQDRINQPRLDYLSPDERATVDEAVEALRTVASFHDPNPHTGDSHCWECRNPWPCPTIRLIGGTDE